MRTTQSNQRRAYGCLSFNPSINTDASDKAAGAGYVKRSASQIGIRMHINTNISGCTLRSWEKEDKPALVRNANNRKVWRNLTDTFPHPYTEANADFWTTIANQATPSIHFAIDLEGATVGGIGIISAEDIARHTGQFGYWLGETYWGKGIATAAAHAMVAHAFSGSLFQRLEAPVFAWNPASMRVLEKAWFIR
jgi:RimJ/RimL family protein N-acetyltransferase